MRSDDLPLWERALIASYHWRRVDPVPRATLRKPIADCRVALVTTAGLVPPDLPPFDLGRLGGDASFRVIPSGAEVATLELQHRSQAFDRMAVMSDRNVAFPLDVLSELEERGEVGETAPRHLSFMGSITAPARLRKEHAPAAAELLVSDGVEVALLAPV